MLRSSVFDLHYHSFFCPLTVPAMKHLLLASLMASALASSAAAAAVPTELCSGGNLPQPSTAAGASKVTDCKWPSNALLKADSTVTSLAVSGGSAVDMVTFDLSTPFNAFALTISDAFTTSGHVIIKGTLIAGSSISITGLVVNIPAMTVAYGQFIDFGALKMTDASLTIADSTVTSAWSCGTFCSGIYLSAGTRTNIAIRNTQITLTTNGALRGVVMDSKTFEDATMTISGNTITGSNSASGYGYGLDFDRRSPMFSSMLPARKGFRGMAGGNGAAAVAKRGRRSQRAAAHAFDPASTDWSTVSDATARTSYGKVTYKITDNTFVNMDLPWDIDEPYGADMTITGNKAYLSAGVGKSVVGKLTQENGNYPVTITISDNALTSSAGKDATIEMSLSHVPVKSTITVSKNVITTGNLDNAAILQLPRATMLPEVNPATFTVSSNRLVALDGTTGVQAKTFVVFYSKDNINYYGTISPSAFMTLCSNVVLGTAIDTDALTEAAFYYADKPIPLTPVSKCPVLNGAPSAHFGASCGVLLSATAAMAIAALA